MKKRIFAFLGALLMLFCCTVPTFALTLHPLSINVSPIDPTVPIPTGTERVRLTINSVLQTMYRYLPLIIVVLIVIAVVIIITISEKKMEKERQEKMPPKKKKKNER